MRRLALTMAVVLTVASLAAAAPARVKHVGAVSAVDAAARTITIDAMGPLASGRVASAAVRITLDDDTVVAAVRRDTLGLTEWRGDFVASTIPATHLAVGDYVVAECERMGKTVMARVITIVRPEEP